ncbi:TPM domain-containing protein [Carboxylicivirga sp. M1479]|uniref:TPM domain-containing protein n=1 Tax=Carboxylicivirga sp. M1479 TaxID=2594476 RepID=UPI001178999E|nr:TPM domain-containing protein [Carboxylicivirga sp. M1479]TRX62968.1 TPM domain-containing protein [Carboxylicivirga sp. M1479]
MAKDFFSESERKQIVDAIKQAELNTSGEIRVHLDKHCNENVLDRAAYWFEKLQMHQTEQRNGVLFYLAYEDHKFAVLGDAGINQKVPDDFWNSIKDLMLANFKEGRFADGLANGIIESGKQLRAHFPYQSDDVNELSDEISFGDK